MIVVIAAFSLYAQMPPQGLETTHQNAGITCESCHGPDMSNMEIKKEKCIECHGDYDNLIQTSSVHFYGANPHWTESPAECSECHSMHKESIFACDRCHE